MLVPIFINVAQYLKAMVAKTFFHQIANPVDSFLSFNDLVAIVVTYFDISMDSAENEAENVATLVCLDVTDLTRVGFADSAG